MPFDPAHAETLAFEVRDKIAHVTLNRPEKRNAMNAAFWTECPALFDWMSDQPDIRCAIVSGAGKMFTAGIDLTLLAGMAPPADADPARVRERLYRKIKAMQETFRAVARCRVPVIAAVHNGCLGAGVDLVTACCLRLCTEDAYFTIQEVNIGMVADVGTLQRIGTQLPEALVRELAYTGRPFRAAEAAAHGFVNAVVPDQATLLAKAEALAGEIAGKSPLAMAGIKQCLSYARDHPVDDALDQVAMWNAGMLLGADIMTGAKAALAKTDASYDDLLA